MNIREEFEKAFEENGPEYNNVRLIGHGHKIAALWAAKFAFNKAADILKSAHIKKGGFGHYENEIRNLSNQLEKEST